MYQLPFEVPEISYDEALAIVHGALRFGICPLLETVEDMLAELGDPDLAFDCVQVAGTNGKTSTSRYTAAILSGEGLRTALYTSPELVSYTERMEIAGSPVSEEAFAHGVSAARVAGERVNARRAAAGERPYDITEFDTLTVAAMVVFAEAGVDVAVLECGMGGRWDATSAAKSIKSVAVTGIGLDHMRVLGNTLEEIAGEKAAIIKPGRTCVLGAGTASPASVEQVFLDQARAAGVTPVLVRPEVVGEKRPGLVAGESRQRASAASAEPEASPGLFSPDGLPVASFHVTKHPHRIGAPLELDVATPRATYAELSALKPEYQAQNIACAVALAESYLRRALNEDALFTSVVQCPTPGRFQLLRPEPPVLIDACHNPQSVEAFLTAIDAVAPNRDERPVLLAAVLADKDVAGIVALLAAAFPRVAVTQTASPRALPADELARAFVDAGAEVVGTYPTVEAATSALCGESYVGCGSITLAGELAALFA
ncbi:bifunctional folylpolyglutamate synthase/dihydrofolate synthase [Thermophilibacter provencensis]|uniref:tetrahydrofolate synthase n=1 Tax=Thermophilibacter provencensis TaxID=1852386 RepID=A0ABT7V576_9ACTN|nr:Mur ligase family protein [Thermophilibacter provencensis]MDM8271748.1 Mur ligase family protein [Thermophilibacter provencensis]